MIRTLLLYGGIIAAVISSSVGLVFIPDLQFLRLEPYRDEAGITYPSDYTDAQARGRRVYIDLGCVYCHSQQVRPEGFGADIERGWGMRRTVARDYLFDSPHLLGTMRTGPDLVNIGGRQPDANWHLQHLYDPELTSPGSIMPPMRFLFERRKLNPGEPPPREAIKLPPGTIEAGWVLLPSRRAADLVSYLQGLDHSAALPEVPQ